MPKVQNSLIEYNNNNSVNQGTIKDVNHTLFISDWPISFTPKLEHCKTDTPALRDAINTKDLTALTSHDSIKTSMNLTSQ